ncbi:MAG: DUF5606 domain-containing protein [Bacteroidetes bacterium]|nr:DUF5606 domain-containing protein [Bacteroidota bacterium]
MEYNKIVAVTGLPGLFELLTSKADGAIVRSLEDKSTKFISSRIHNFSHLESIEVFTKRENVNLVNVLKAMEANSEKIPDEKDNDALKKYFIKIYPDIDLDRVYSSDLKKMIKWFSILKKNNIELKLSEPAAEEKETIGEAKIEKVVTGATTEIEKEEKPKAKKADLKTAKAEAKTATGKEAKPKPKKSTEEKPKKSAEKKKSAKK